MADQSKIEWTDATWNPTRGCKVKSRGCKHCYAMKVAARFAGPGLRYEGLAFMHENAGGQWTGKGRFVDDHLLDPLRWKRPRRIFVNSMSDLFYEGFSVDEIAAVFAVMYLAPHHTFQVLTKRSERMREVLNDPRFYPMVLAAADRIRNHLPKQTRKHTSLVGISDPTKFPAKWVHLGVSVEGPECLDRLTDLANTPAGLRFASFEPLLESLGNIRSWLDGDTRLDWVIVGGESGREARPIEVSWVRSIVEQCYLTRVPCFVKQLGAHVLDRNDAGFDGDGDDTNWPRDTCTDEIDIAHSYQGEPVRVRLESTKGGDPAEWPADLRVREFPEVRR